MTNNDVHLIDQTTTAAIQHDFAFEGNSIVDVAEKYGLSPSTIEAVLHDYVIGLQHAVADAECWLMFYRDKPTCGLCNHPLTERNYIKGGCDNCHMVSNVTSLIDLAGEHEF